MITDDKGEQIEPEPGMTIMSLYSLDVYEIAEVDNEKGRIITKGGKSLPIGLDYKLVKT